MNYYNEIKKELLDNEINKKVKDYSNNKYEIEKYYNVGKLLLEAGNNYGEGIIKEYSIKLTKDIGKKYSVRYLFDIRKLYLFAKVHPLGAQLTMSHYRLLFPLTDDNEINYYIDQVAKRNLSKRQLEEIIKYNEYKRLPEDTKNKLNTKQETNIIGFVKNPIIIKNSNNYEIISEKILQKLILEDIESFMRELGNSFCFIGSEYKIKIGDSYHKMDLLLFNIKYNSYVVSEVEPNICLRLAALFHDIGKPPTYTEDISGIGHFYNHWNKSIEIFSKYQRNFGLTSEEINLIINLIFYHDINVEKLNNEGIKKWSMK